MSRQEACGMGTFPEWKRVAAHDAGRRLPTMAGVDDGLDIIDACLDRVLVRIRQHTVSDRCGSTGKVSILHRDYSPAERCTGATPWV
jgi:hypothetical protein